jgi:hypothetical protein
MTIPKAFISYSHDTLEHKKWVLELATRLRNNGIDAILDQFELQPGDDVPHFMEKHLASANKILMICTEKYVEKANQGQGGVGYEKMIITSNLMKSIDENKIIPIIKQIGTTIVPTFLKSKLYINFSKNDDYEFSYDDLVRTIHNAPLFEKPAVGNNPFKPVVKEKLDGDINLLNSVLASIAICQELNSYATSSEVMFKSNISAPLFLVLIPKLIKLGYVTWNYQPTSVCITEKGLNYAFENGLL